MATPGLFIVAVIGLLAGTLARRLVGRRDSTFASLMAGLTGAVLGAAAASLLGLPMQGLAPIAAAALAGSAALLSVMTLVLRR